jgi:hypothetical protein
MNWNRALFPSLHHRNEGRAASSKQIHAATGKDAAGVVFRPPRRFWIHRKTTPASRLLMLRPFGLALRAVEASQHFVDRSATPPCGDARGIAPYYRFVIIAFVLTLFVGTPFFLLLSVQGEALRNSLSDQEFWRIVTTLSEPGGKFQAQVMSNEDSAQFVIPTLKQTTRPDGVYVGVGTEQNFTYIAAIRPQLAFVIDIRRDNMLEHLMYKSLFELSADRADFLARLFSRKRPAGLDANASVKVLFDTYQSVEASPGVYEESLRAIIDRLVNTHKFHLTDEDKASIGSMLNIFRTSGPNNLTGQGDKNMSYARLMAATDLAGRNHSYLASEENFRIVQDLEKRNLIVPLVGDFAGDTALVGVGRYLKEHDAVVNVFYVSNVERYLFEQGDHGKHFYANVASLPLDSSSTFVRSVTVDISRRLGIPIPQGNADWRSFFIPINNDLKALDDGRIRS